MLKTVTWNNKFLIQGCDPNLAARIAEQNLCTGQASTEGSPDVG